MAVGGPTYAVTEAVTNIGATTATAGGVAYPGDGATITGRGVVMGTSPKSNQNPYPDYFQNQFPAASAGPGQFTVPLTGLTPGQTYYLCAYAVDDSQTGSGIYYGGEVSFTVPAAHTSARSDTQAVADQIRKSPRKRATDAVTQAETTRRNTRKQPADTAGQTETTRRSTRKRTSDDSVTTADATALRIMDTQADSASAAIDFRRNLARNPRLLSSNGSNPTGGAGYSPGGTGSLSNTDGVQTINLFAHTGGNSRFGVMLQGTYALGATNPPYSQYSVSIDMDEITLDGTARLEIYVELLNGNGAETQYRNFNLGDTPGRKYATFTAGAFNVTSFNVYVFFVMPAGWTGNARAIMKNLMVERGDTRGSYFDGTTPGASWVGAPDYSQSTLPVTVKTVGKRLNDVSPAQEGIRLGMTRLVADAVNQSDSMSKKQGYGLRPADTTLTLDGSLRNDTPIITNMIPNPSFENEISPAGNVNSGPVLLTQSGAWSAFGSFSLRIAANSANADTSAHYGGDTGTLRLGMEAGKTYTVSATARLEFAQAGTVQNTRARRIVAFTRIGTGPYVETFGTVLPNVDGSTGVVYTTFTIPPNATEAFIRLYNGSSNVNNPGSNIWYDNVMLVEGSTPYAYGDGDSFGWRWNGVSGSSTSYGPANGDLMREPSFRSNLNKIDTAIAADYRENLFPNPQIDATGSTAIPAYMGAYANGGLGTRYNENGVLKLTATELVNASRRYGILFNTMAVNVAGGDTLMYSVDITELNLPPTTRAVMYVDMYNGGTHVAGRTLIINSTGRSYLVLTPPSDTRTMTAYVWIDSTAPFTGEASVSFARPMLERTTFQRPYFDGSMPEASWAGAGPTRSSRMTGVFKNLQAPKSDTAIIGDGLDGLNAVENGNYETPAVGGASVWPVPGWATASAATGNQPVIDPTGGRNGSRGASMTVDGNNTYIGIRQAPPTTPLKTDTQYTAMFDHKADTNGVLVEYSIVAHTIANPSAMRFLGNDGNWYNYEVILNTTSRIAWQTVSHTFKLPPGMEVVRFFPIKRGFVPFSAGKTITIDTVKIVESGLTKIVGLARGDNGQALDQPSKRPSKRARDVAHASKKYYTFNGGGGITIPHTEAINVGNNDNYTVIFKFRTNSRPSEQSISEKWVPKAGSINKYPFAVRGPQGTTGGVLIGIYDTSTTPFTNPGVRLDEGIDDGQWHTGVFARSWSDKRLYGFLDGLLKMTSADTTSGDVSTDRDISLGMRSGSFLPFYGDIAEFIILRDIAMSASEVADYQATGVLPKTPALHIVLNDSSDWPIVNDISPSGANGVLAAGTAVLNEEPSDVQSSNVGKRVADSATALHSMTLRNVRRFLTDTAPAIDLRRINANKRPADAVQALDDLRKFIRDTVADSASASDEPFNLVNNGSFEEPLAGTFGMSRAGLATQDTKYAMDGSNSLKMASIGIWDSISRTGYIPVTPGQKYTAQVIVNTEVPHTSRPSAEGGSNNAATRLYFFWRRANGSVITEGEFDWTNLANVQKNRVLWGTRTAPADAVFISIHIYQYGIGEAWYDNMSLIEGEGRYNMENGKLVAVSKSVGSAKADQLAALDAISKLYRKNINNDAVTPADARRIRAVLRKMDTATLTDILVKKVAKRLADTTNILDSIRKSPRVRKADVATVADAIRKAIALGIFDSIIMSDIGEDELIRKAYTVLRARAGRGNVGQSDTIKARSMR